MRSSGSLHREDSRSLNPEDGTDSLFRNVVRNYHYSLRNSPEERSYHLLRGGSLKLRIPGVKFHGAGGYIYFMRCPGEGIIFNLGRPILQFKKFKFALEHSKAQRGSRCIVLLFL